MKNQPFPQQRGIALVIVLAMLVLLSGMIIGFFLSVTTERQASSSATSSIQARQVADSTVNLAIAQIRDATSQSNNGAAWASQPGAIRTYTNASADVYKLYSADKMIEPESSYNSSVTSDTFLPATATERQFGFVDLNEPAAAADRTMTYPIIHPMAKFDITGITQNKPLVEGFNCADITGAGAVPLLPLNVKWMYVLKDGSIGTLDTLAANPVTEKRPSRANPVVARTAFWADDESAKININTASEGTFWDTPHVSTFHEIGDVDGGYAVTPAAADTSLNLAVAQPVQGEYQRYTGHPATTSLSPVLRRLYANASTHSDAGYKDLIYRLSPHIYSDVYSKTGWLTNLSTSAATRNKSNPNATQSPLGDDGDRLYTSVDEMMFTASRRTEAGVIQENSAILPLLTPKVLDRMRFFLTAQSRAPEMNLFGRPRIAIWPVPKDPNLRTGYDKAFAFTSTLAPAETDGTKIASKQKAYYFTREVTADPTKSGSRDPSIDYSGSPRNQALFSYLQNLTSKEVPGFKSSFSKTYNSDTNQILTEIYDYIRCTSLVDTTGKDQNGNTKTNAFAATPYSVPYSGTGLAANDSSGVKPNEWSGQVMPIKIGNNHGLGRFITLSEVAVSFFVPETVTAGKEAATSMRAVLIFEFATPMGGYMGLRDTYSFKISEVEGDGLKVDGVSVFPTAAGTLGFCVGEVDALNSSFGRSQTPNRGFTASMLMWSGANSTATPKTFKTSGSSSVDRTAYPFLSSPIAIGSAKDATFKIEGGTYKMELYAGPDPTIEKMRVQTINFTIAPKDVFNGKNGPVKLPKPWTDGTKGRKFESQVVDGGTSPIFGNGNLDVVRSTAVKRGDYRVTSVMDPVPVNMFENPTDSDKGTNRIVHLLRYGHSDAAPGWSAKGNFAGKVGGQNATIRDNKPPDLDSSTAATGVLRSDGAEGDWSRGVSKHVDAPFGNKPDEGNFMFDSGQSGIYRLPYMRGNFSRISDDTNFSPNRLVPSPVMFGSLPTGSSTPTATTGARMWQTLLFRPDHHKLGQDHPGSGKGGNVPDHLLLDLFWMPIVEPYAISEPCSTAGKINLNFVIAPFGYLKQGSKPYVQRDTGIRAVLKGAKLTAVPYNMTDGGHNEGISNTAPKVRFDIDPDLTIGDMANRLYTPSKGLFRSASEICEMDLYPYSASSANPPAGADLYPSVNGFKIPKTAADFDTFWNENGLTGDEGREQPYNSIYPRVTTKSNIFTVHIRSQAVQIPPSYYKTGATGDIDVKMMKDDFGTKGDVVKVSSEYRGSATVERFIDPNDPALATYTAGNAELNSSLDPYYRFRIVNTKRFMP